MAPTSELVFVLTRPRGRFAEVVSALGDLWSGELPSMERVDATFDATRNRVLISAHYDSRALTDGVRTRIQILARDAGVVVLDGAALDDDDRRALVAEGEHRVDNQPALAIALWNLARLMGGEEVWAGQPEPLPPLEPRTITASQIAERGSEYGVRPARPVGLVPPAPPAPSTRQRPPTPRGLGPSSPLPGPAHVTGVPPRPPTGTRAPVSRTTTGLRSAAQARTTTATRPPVPARTGTGNSSADMRDLGHERFAAGSSARVSTRRNPGGPPSEVGSRATEQAGRSIEDGTAPKIELDAPRPPSPPDAPPRRERVTPARFAEPRSMMPAPALVAPGPIERMASGTLPVVSRAGTDDRIDSGPVTVADPVARGKTEPSTEPYMPSLQSRHEASSIDVRYLRSGRWAPARLRALSLKGAYLITAAFPRVGDHVHIALGLGDLGALVRGVVFHVTTAADIASTGTSGFAVRFDLDDAARAQLSTLLHRARARGVTITPPPPRGSVRLPVQWPVKLATQRGAVKGDALDVSRGGMFVHAMRALDLEQPVSFSAVLDDGSAPISGRARVVREINEADAARRGLRPGFGLSIQEMGDADIERWNQFLARVQRRGEHRILVGASPARLAEVTAGLTGAGYAVVGGTDPGTLVQLSDAESRPPDVAVIDATLLEGSEPNWLETLFSARKVPCVTLRGDARRARVVVDRLLAV